MGLPLPGVGTAERQQLVVAAALDDFAVVEHEDQVGVARELSRSCEITSVVRSRARSVSEAASSASSPVVGSSRISTGASASSARAIAIRWRWPPDSRRPRSPRSVS